LKQRVLSGMRPTGRLHLGHLEGVLRNWVKLQDEYECFFFVADWHALTDNLDTSNIPEYVQEMILDWLAAGISPEKALIFVQSQVPQHAVLHLLLSMVTPLGWVERCPTFKEKIREEHLEERASYGLLGYPILQAADIIIHKAELVPVGEDQLPHLELTREIVRRFHYLFGCEIFPEPQPLLTEVAKLVGIDGRKMSKSYNNAILLSETPEEVAKKVRMMITDPARIRKTDKGHPEVCSVFSYHKIYSKEALAEIEQACRNAQIGCVECKDRLAKALNEYLEPFRQKRVQLEGDRAKVFDIINEGNKRARESAQATIDEVAQVMHLKY